MGYCYNSKNQLVCDVCGHANGTTRKRKCPHGWCQPAAICKSCWNKPEIKEQYKQYHITHECEKHKREFDEREKQRTELIEDGKFVRCSARTDNNGKIHVLFQGKHSIEGRYMQKETYHAIPYLENATIEDYERFGKLEIAPSQFIYA